MCGVLNQDIHKAPAALRKAWHMHERASTHQPATPTATRHVQYTIVPKHPQSVPAVSRTLTIATDHRHVDSRTCRRTMAAVACMQNLPS